MSQDLIRIAAHEGEGGGQVLRSSLALSIITQRPVLLEGIRAKRSKPGLMRQHLTAVKAAQAICDATVQGAELGSQTLRFEPNAIRPGDYHFAIGTAGSTGLVLQTILPPLMIAHAPSSLRLEGGTHNPLSPSTDFLRTTFLPQLHKIGPHVDLKLIQHGFYPAGGGHVQAHITPTPRQDLKRLELIERGEEQGRGVMGLVSQLRAEIARREAERVVELMGWTHDAITTQQVTSPGPGNVLLATLAFEHVTEQLTAFGERGKPAERVADDLVHDIKAYLASGAPVGEHLADQLLLPMALNAGGKLLISAPSQHTLTQANIIQKFLDVRIHLERAEHHHGRAWWAAVITPSQTP